MRTCRLRDMVRSRSIASFVKSSKLAGTKKRKGGRTEREEMQDDSLGSCRPPLSPERSRRLIFEKSRKIIRACGARRCLFLSRLVPPLARHRRPFPQPSPCIPFLQTARYAEEETAVWRTRARQIFALARWHRQRYSHGCKYRETASG